MTDSGYVKQLERKLEEVDQSLAQARGKMEEAGGDVAEKALHELSELEMRRKSAAERLEAAKQAHAEDWSTLHASFREELDGIADTVEKWFLRHS